MRGAIKADDGHSLRLRIILAHHANTKVRRKSRNLGNRPVELDELHAGLASLGILHNHSATDAQIAIPPRRIQTSGVGRDTELDVAGLVGLRAHGLELRGEGVDVAANHGDAVACLVRLANGEGDEGTSVSCDPILAAGLDLVDPRVASRELLRGGWVSRVKRLAHGRATHLLEAQAMELGLEVVDGVEDGRVLGQEFAEWLGICLCLVF